MGKYKSFNADPTPVEYEVKSAPTYLSIVDDVGANEDGSICHYVHEVISHVDPNAGLNADDFKLERVVAAGAVSMLKEVHIDTMSPLGVMDGINDVIRNNPLPEQVVNNSIVEPSKIEE